jgi:hypothetical protein
MNLTKSRRHGECDDAITFRHRNFEDYILMKISELLTVNQSIKGQLNKAEAEIVGKVTELNAKIDELVAAAGNADLPEEVNQSIADVQTAAQALDDIVADPVPVPVE